MLQNCQVSFQADFNNRVALQKLYWASQLGLRTSSEATLNFMVGERWDQNIFYKSNYNVMAKRITAFQHVTVPALSFQKLSLSFRAAFPTLGPSVLAAQSAEFVLQIPLGMLKFPSLISGLSSQDWQQCLPKATENHCCSLQISFLLFGTRTELLTLSKRNCEDQKWNSNLCFKQ